MHRLLTRYAGHVIGIATGILIFASSVEITQKLYRANSTTPASSYQLLDTKNYFQMLRYSATRTLNGDPNSLLAYPVEVICSNKGKDSHVVEGALNEALSANIKGNALPATVILASKRQENDLVTKDDAGLSGLASGREIYQALLDACKEKNAQEREYLLTNSKGLVGALNSAGSRADFVAVAK